MNTTIHLDTIAICDDEPLVQDILRSALEFIGIDVVISSSGGELLEQIRAQPIRGILLDYRLEEECGLDVLNQIKLLASEILVPPVCICSGFPDQRAPALFSGATHFLEKPCSVPEIHEVARELVQLSRLASA